MAAASPALAQFRKEGMTKGKLCAPIWMLVPLIAMGATPRAQIPPGAATPVTLDNYNRAQTDVNFAGAVRNGGFGKFVHGRVLAPVDQRGIIRPNRDTLYSMAVFDLDAGPVTITLPPAGKRYR
jgi:hypothetical protein